MFDQLLQIVAPHYCYSCQKIGATLCEDCKYDIIDESFSGCLLCRRLTVNGNTCAQCNRYLSKGWAVGERSEILQALLDGYKFKHERATAHVLADLLHRTLPVLPEDTIIAPLPTISSHIRQRGFDHTAQIARSFAKQRSLAYRCLLTRASSTKQFGASRSVRIKQAQRAYSAKQIDENMCKQPILLIDDVVTTGASIEYAAKALKDSGVEKIWAATIAWQPLDANR